MKYSIRPLVCTLVDLYIYIHEKKRKKERKQRQEERPRKLWYTNSNRCPFHWGTISESAAAIVVIDD
jgi:hypothetical protein